MEKKNGQDSPCWRIKIACNEVVGGLRKLGEEDVKHLEAAAKFVAALIDAVPVEAECEVMLDAPYLLVYLVPSDAAPIGFDAEKCHRLAEEITATISKVAIECRENARTAKPVPLKKAVTSAAVVPMLRALANSDKKSALAVVFEGPGGEIQLPTLAPSDFTAGEDDAERKITKTKVPVTGLIYNRRDKEIAIELQDFTGHIDLPPLWTWQKMRDALDNEMTVSGTLVRKGNGKWHLSDDALLEQKLV